MYVYCVYIYIIIETYSVHIVYICVKVNATQGMKSLGQGFPVVSTPVSPRGSLQSQRRWSFCPALCSAETAESEARGLELDKCWKPRQQEILQQFLMLEHFGGNCCQESCWLQDC